MPISDLVQEPVEHISREFVKLATVGKPAVISKTYALLLDKDFPVERLVNHPNDAAMAGWNLAIGSLRIVCDSDSTMIQRTINRLIRVANLIKAECRSNQQFGCEKFPEAIESYLMTFLLIYAYLRERDSLESKFEVRSHISDLVSLLAVKNPVGTNLVLRMIDPSKLLRSIISELDTENSITLGRNLPVLEDDERNQLVGRAVSKIWEANFFELYFFYFELHKVLPFVTQFSEIEAESDFPLVCQPLADRADVRDGLARIQSAFRRKML